MSSAGSPPNPFEAAYRQMCGWSIPVAERIPARRRADQNVQQRTAARRRLIARCIQDLACARVERGLPYDVVLDRCAVGSLEVQEWFEARGEKAPSRTTIISDCEAILGSRTGRLPVVPDFDRYGHCGGQAYTYSLRDLYRTLGRAGRNVQRAIAARANRIRGGATPRRPSYIPAKFVSPISLTRHARRSLEKAINNAVGGNRHRTGVGLAWHLAHVGVPERTVHELIAEYHAAVTRVRGSGRRYESAEAHAAVESAYRKVLGRTTRHRPDGRGYVYGRVRGQERRFKPVNDVQWLLANPAPGGLLELVRKVTASDPAHLRSDRSRSRKAETPPLTHMG